VTSSTNSRLMIAWLVLVAITLIYLSIDSSADKRGVLVASTTVTVTAVFLALVKFRIIMREFMDVRHAPRLLRRLSDILVVVIGISLLATYAVGRALT
jgi:Prokaryotic Cytochrome C oxidase subunit IV